MLALTIRQNEWNNSQGTDQLPQLSDSFLGCGQDGRELLWPEAAGCAKSCVLCFTHIRTVTLEGYATGLRSQSLEGNLYNSKADAWAPKE